MNTASNSFGSGGSTYAARIPRVAKLMPGATLEINKDNIVISNEFSSYTLEHDAPLISVLARVLQGKLRADKLTRYKQEIHDLLFRLVCQGLICDATEPCSWELCSGLNAVPLIVREIDAECLRTAGTYEGLNPIMNGTASRLQVIGWLLENFHFTRLATYHIPPVLNHTKNKRQYDYWHHFMKEEATHWKIYKHAFTELGWDIEEAKTITPLAPTQAFVDFLQKSAAANQYIYAAILLFVERPPDVETVEEDELFSILFKKYGFTRKAVMPLWIHSCLNEKLNHDSLGAEVISSKKLFRKEELAQLRTAIRDIITVTLQWYKGIHEGYLNGPSLERYSLPSLQSFYKN